MKPLVKICGLSDSVAVQAAVEAGAGAVGFVFADSVRRISPADAARLAANLPTQIVRVRGLSPAIQKPLKRKAKILLTLPRKSLMNCVQG